jgi:Asp-tRNA(Asn)/Glu-tRNA(Gln) amidotransferase A subunit family amidase
VLRGLHHQLVTRQRSSVEVTDAYLAAIAASQPALNAFSAVCPDAARKQAQAADARLAAGAPLGPLDGIPFSVKVRVLRVCETRVSHRLARRCFR